MTKIYCPQIEAMTICDCFDKCDTYKVRIKTGISKILQSTLNESNTEYRTESGSIRWDLVEREIHEAVDDEQS